MLATIVMTILVFVLFMFKVAMFIIYFDYILSIPVLLLCVGTYKQGYPQSMIKKNKMLPANETNPK
jgi:hypothetical protein